MAGSVGQGFDPLIGPLDSKAPYAHAAYHFPEHRPRGEVRALSRVALFWQSA